ncbi:MAG TPA: aminotransferase class IV [Pirellulales bacterium]|jgi:branched-chain amino acid aminotransferase
MPQRVVYFNGRFVPEAEARVSIYDSSLVMGDMAFEVTRTVGQQPFRLDDHLRRLAHTMAELRIDPGLSADEWRSTTIETLARNRSTEAANVDWNIIHNVSRGPAGAFADAFAPADMRPTVIVSCYPLVEKLAALAPCYEHGIDLVVPRQRSLPGRLLDDALKTRSRLHYQLANLQAAEIRPGAWAALVDPAGHLTEGTSGNLFLVRGGELLTPKAENLLPGITRQLVIDLAEQLRQPWREADLTVADAAAASEIFVTSTSIGILHARTFEGVSVSDGRLGPVATRLRAALAELMGVDFAAQAAEYAQLRAGRLAALGPSQDP